MEIFATDTLPAAIEFTTMTFWCSAFKIVREGNVDYQDNAADGLKYR